MCRGFADIQVVNGVEEAEDAGGEAGPEIESESVSHRYHLDQRGEKHGKVDGDCHT